jgi:hypothetical protein
MFGQLCVVVPGVVLFPGEVDGEAPVEGVGLVSGAGEVAAWAIAKLPNPPPNARLAAIRALGIQPRARFCIE